METNKGKEVRSFSSILLGEMDFTSEEQIKRMQPVMGRKLFACALARCDFLSSEE